MDASVSGRNLIDCTDCNSLTRNSIVLQEELHAADTPRALQENWGLLSDNEKKLAALLLVKIYRAMRVFLSLTGQRAITESGTETSV